MVGRRRGCLGPKQVPPSCELLWCAIDDQFSVLLEGPAGNLEGAELLLACIA